MMHKVMIAAMPKSAEAAAEMRYVAAEAAKKVNATRAKAFSGSRVIRRIKASEQRIAANTTKITLSVASVTISEPKTEIATMMKSMRLKMSIVLKVRSMQIGLWNELQAHRAIIRRMADRIQQLSNQGLCLHQSMA